MCGIVGLLTTRRGGFMKSEIDLFNQMLYVDALRGPDSTGAFCVHNNSQVSGFKHAAPPQVTQSVRGYQDFTDGAFRDGRILIGHNRKATHGTISNENSHPFYEDHIILVHNGMLHNQQRYKKQRSVDSNTFAAELAHTHADEVKQLIADVDGAYAFVWWDMEQKKLFFVRNDQRPLCVAEYEGKYVFSSEPWLLHGLCHRVEGSSIKHDESDRAWEMWSTKPGLLYSLDMNGNLASEELPAKKSTVVYHRPGNTTTTTASQATATSNTNSAETKSAATSSPAPRVQQQQADVSLLAGPSPSRNNAPVTGTKTTGSVLPFNRQFPSKTSGPVKTFSMGDHIVVKLTRATWNQQGVALIEGKVQQIGKPDWDITGELPRETDIADLQNWLDNPLVGTITAIHTGLPCGPTMKVKDLFLSPIYLATKSWNKQALHGPEWQYITNECRCKHCERKVDAWDRPFTNVKVDDVGNVEVICADCVEERIENEEVKKQFEQARITALDNWQPVSYEAGFRIDGKTQVEGPSTLQ